MSFVIGLQHVALSSKHHSPQLQRVRPNDYATKLQDGDNADYTLYRSKIMCLLSNILRQQQSKLDVSNSVLVTMVFTMEDKH